MHHKPNLNSDAPGESFVPELLMPMVLELEKAWAEAKKDTPFWEEPQPLNQEFTAHPSPIYHAKRLSDYIGGAKAI